MELQDGLDHFEKNRIRPYAISYDPVDTLARFARKHDITYPLLADTNSAVIRRFGIFNTLVPEGHRWYGVPLPGTYMVDEEGLVTNRSFYANHGVRDSISRMLQESFHIDPERGPVQTFETEHIKATAALSAGTVRRGQVHTLTLELELRPGLHIYGRPLPKGYIPTTLTFENLEDVHFGDIHYPKSTSLRLKALNETLPVYEGHILLKTTLQNRRRGDFTVRARLDYQACDDRACYPPADLTFELPLTYLDNA